MPKRTVGRKKVFISPPEFTASLAEKEKALVQALCERFKTEVDLRRTRLVVSRSLDNNAKKALIIGTIMRLPDHFVSMYGYTTRQIFERLGIICSSLLDKVS